MTTLEEFLTARLAEDERLAQRANGMRWDDDPADGPGESWVLNEDMHLFETDAQTAAFIARHDPKRELAEVALKRRIIEVCEDAYRGDHAAEFVQATDTLEALASAYADHPDYDESWKP